MSNIDETINTNSIDVVTSSRAYNVSFALYHDNLKNKSICVTFEEYCPEEGQWLIKTKSGLAFWAFLWCCRNCRYPALIGRQKIRNMHFVIKKEFENYKMTLSIAYACLERQKLNKEKINNSMFQKSIESQMIVPALQYLKNISKMTEERLAIEGLERELMLNIFIPRVRKSNQTSTTKDLVAYADDDLEPLRKLVKI